MNQHQSDQQNGNAPHSNVQGNDQQQFAGQAQMGASSSNQGYMGQQPIMMNNAGGPPNQGMMSNMYQQQQPAGTNGNGPGSNQLMQMGYMHDGAGQYMMQHGQQNNAQLPASTEGGVPMMMRGIDENQGQIPSMLNMGGGAQGQPGNYDGDNQNYDDDGSGEDGANKGKRRSKNDVEGRDFKCGYCPKTYLSYPALYTHIKQKHSKGPDGEMRAPPTSGRGRGRPRKNPYHRTDPQKEAYFQQEDKKGGPTDPLLWFHDHYETILKDSYSNIEEYPLYKHLKQFSPSKPCGENPGEKAENGKDSAKEKKSKASKAAAEEKEEGKDENRPEADVENQEKEEVDWKAQGWERNYLNLSESEKMSMFVDEIFALYLYTVSEKVNDSFYRTVLAFVIFFRECLNEIGWKKRRESDNDTKPEDLDKLEEKEFCLVNTAEHAPEICNEFVTIYMEKNKSKFEIIKCEQIDLTINMCHWLFENQYTCSKLTMIT